MNLYCDQVGCKEPPAYRYTWPGRDETGICEEHVGWLRQVIVAIDLALEIIPLEKEEKKVSGYITRIIKLEKAIVLHLKEKSLGYDFVTDKEAVEYFFDVWKE